METVNITYLGIPMEVEGTYTPPDLGIRYHSDMSGTPPTSAQFDIDSVFIESVDITQLLSYRQLEEIEELCINNLLE